MDLTVGDLLKEQGERLRLELVAGEKSLGRRITVPDLNRPGLALSGFTESFRAERVQIFGNGEQAYLRAAEATQTTSYAWIDKDKGVVQLPLERAMELTVKQYGAKK